MKKIHTQIKRKWGLTTSKKHYSFFHKVESKPRQKTFKTEEAANEYAEKLGLTQGGYKLSKVKHNKKFKITRLKQ